METTVREQEIIRLEKEIAKASKAKRFIESDDGGYVIEYLKALISTYTNQLLNNRKTQEEYIEIRAQIVLLRKIVQVLEVQGSEKVLGELSSRLSLAESE